MFKRLLSFIITLVVIGGITFVGYRQYSQAQQKKQANAAYLAFLSESWDTIQQNYWDKLTDAQLSTLYQLSANKVTNENIATPSGKAAFLTEIDIVLGKKPVDERKQTVTQITDVVLANLYPFGRSRLYSQTDAENLQKNVANLADKDHYQNLGVAKNADQKQITDTFSTKQQELDLAATNATDEAEKEVIYQQQADLQKSYSILKDADKKAIYDQAGAEPTLDYRLLSPRTLYLHLSKFSPTSLTEIQTTVTKFDQGKVLDTLVLDLQGNIGGAIDGLPVYLGPFLGKNQLAYSFYHQGVKTPYYTTSDWLKALNRYKRVIVLIDKDTQSTAEVMASVLSKYNIGLLVGTTTKGWGTIERIFDIQNQIDKNEKYGIFLVHSLTVGEADQPIQGNGVTPKVDVSLVDWEQTFKKYYPDQQLINSIKTVLR